MPDNDDKLKDLRKELGDLIGAQATEHDTKKLGEMSSRVKSIREEIEKLTGKSEDPNAESRKRIGAYENLPKREKNMMAALERELQDLFAKRGRATDPAVYDVMDKRIKEIITAMGANPETDEKKIRQELKAKLTPSEPSTPTDKKSIPKTSTPQINIPGITKKKSAQEQIAELQLKKLKQEMRPRVGSPKFALPKIATERATEIVIGCIISIFLIEIGAGTKFTALWNYAFTNVGLDAITNPTTEIIGNKPTKNLAPLNTNPTGINPLNTGSDVFRPFDTPAGFGDAYANAWGYGNILHGIEFHGIHS